MKIEPVRDHAGLAAIEAEWWDLWGRSVTTTPFQTPAWLISWWRAFHPGELFTVAARRQGRLVGLAPFYRDGLRLLPLGISVSDYLDLLLDPEFENEIGPAMLSHVARSELDWDEWEFAELKPHARALELPAPTGLDEQVEDQSPCPVLELPGTLEDLRQTLSRKKRCQIRNARNRAARRGEVVIKRVEVGGLEQAYCELIRLHEARWRSREAPGVIADERVRRFHSMALEPLARRDLLRFYLLTIAGKAVGVYLGLQDRGRAYAYLMGFDPDHAFESPGTILLAHAIEEAVREGSREFHFLRGNEGYKYGWGPTDRWNKRRVFRRVHAHAET